VCAAGSLRAMTERRLVLLIGAVQFINVLDFMMVMPLGPDFAQALGIPSSKLGIIGGSYTAAACVAGLVGAFFLDRFDRRKALAFTLAGLALGTIAGAFATGMWTLVLARVLAGAFGGPATAISLAIITDAIPPERRGRAMGAVMGAFSVASVLGVPAGLELASRGGWRAPFVVVGLLGAVITALAIRMLPPQRAHLGRDEVVTPFREVLRRPIVVFALAATTVAVIANFSMIPNLSAYFQFNRGYPREDLGLLYLVGGIVSFGTLRLAGWLTDRYGAPAVATFGSAWFIVVLFVGFIAPIEALPVLLVFVTFMISGSFRFVPLQALSSRVPSPSERARFMSAQSAVQHLAQSVGAMIGAAVLTEQPDHTLLGIDELAWFAVAMSIVLPPLLYVVDASVRRQQR
jgi:predicted MFS family arabinose efflux permease